jgi:hypothetical protein
LIDFFVVAIFVLNIADESPYVLVDWRIIMRRKASGQATSDPDEVFFKTILAEGKLVVYERHHHFFKKKLLPCFPFLLPTRIAFP